MASRLGAQAPRRPPRIGSRTSKNGQSSMAEKDLARLQQELNEKAALIDLAHDAIVVLGPVDDRIRYWNRGAQDLYGYTALEAIGQVGGQLLKRVAPASIAEMVTKASESDHWDGRLKHTTKSGEELVVDSRWAVLRDGAHAASGILEVNRDITCLLYTSP